MWGNVLTEAFSLKGLAEQTRNGGQARGRKACGHANSLTLSGFPEQTVKEKNNDEEYQDE
jgi:hypothetical protein